jgi:hypothetical protein
MINCPPLYVLWSFLITRDNSMSDHAREDFLSRDRINVLSRSINSVHLLLTILQICCSKLQSEVLKDAISQIVGDAKEKNRKFTETVELQIGLKNYDPQKDKRFSGSVKLPHIPRPKMKVCMLGDAQHVEEV